MQILNQGIKITDAKWDETLLLSSPAALEVDPQDGEPKDDRADQTFNVKWHSTSSLSRPYQKRARSLKSLTFRSLAPTTTMRRWSSRTSTWSVFAPVW